MQKQNKNIDILRHINQYCDEIIQTLDMVNYDQTLFESGFLYKNNCAFCLLQIGELAKHLSKSFTEYYTEIPWKDVKALRNRIAHDYKHTDFDIFWVTLTEDISILGEFCKKVIKASEVIHANALKIREIEDDDIEKEDR